MTEIKAPEGGRPVSEMLERVARAIYEDRNGAGCVPWSRRPEAEKRPYLSDALAVMNAMREPTLAMCQSMPSLPAIHAVDDLPLKHAGWRMGDIQNLKRWRAALDAEISIAEGGSNDRD